jgi:hypothetical protein
MCSSASQTYYETGNRCLYQMTKTLNTRRRTAPDHFFLSTTLSWRLHQPRGVNYKAAFAFADAAVFSGPDRDYQYISAAQQSRGLAYPKGKTRQRVKNISTTPSL